MPHFPNAGQPSLDEALADHSQTMAAFVGATTVWMENALTLLGELVASQNALTDIVDSLSREVAELSANATADHGDHARHRVRRPTPIHRPVRAVGLR
jgi:hypothetical protein